jgi:CBS domain-containing protein
MAAIMKGHARDLMTARVVSATPETPLLDLAELLSSGIGGLPVVNAKSEVIAFVSATDVTRALLAGKPTTTLASAIMSMPVDVVDEFTTTDQVIALLTERNIHHLPVVRSGRLVGIISPADILKHFVARNKAPQLA